MDKTAWFEGKWGVFFHYLANPAGRKNEGKSAEAWSKQIDGFDVKGLAKQLKELGADYFVITIGQGSGHYLANNVVYDELTGIRPSKCSKRDLVAELADELNPMGIKVLVYTVSGALAGLAGLMQFSRLTVGDPTVAIGRELDVIAAVVIGGGSLSGGEGSVLGSIIGALIMTVIRSGCSQMGLPNWVQEIVTGVIIILAVTLDRLRQRRTGQGL